MRTVLFTDNLRSLFSIERNTPILNKNFSYYKISNFEKSLNNINIILNSDFEEIKENLTLLNPLGKIFTDCEKDEFYKRDIFDRLYYSNLELNFKTIDISQTSLYYPICTK